MDRRFSKRRRKNELIALLLIAAIAAGLTVVLVYLSGSRFDVAFGGFLRGISGSSYAVSEVFVKATPIVIRKRSSCSEWNTAIYVRKNIEAVPVSLDYGQRRMGKHPKEQVAKLAETASHSFADLPLTQYQTFEVPLASSRTTDMTPDGEGLSKTYDHTVQLENRAKNATEK